MPQSQDYLLRMIEELGRFAAEVTRLRRTGQHDAALFAILQSQERLFARPSAQFIGRPLEEQIRLLVIGETDANAAEKCLWYARLVLEAGLVYRDRNQAPLALGACRLALQIVDLVRGQFPKADLSDAGARIAELLAAIPDSPAKAETGQMLARVAGSASGGQA